MSRWLILVAFNILSFGKEYSFLAINGYYSPSLDYLFRFWTYLGDGLIWIPLFGYVLLFKRDYLVAVLAGLIICTIVTQILKQVVFPDSYRPIVSIVGSCAHHSGIFYKPRA